VVRKAEPSARKPPARAFELSQDKSALGLAEEYEGEFKKSAMGVDVVRARAGQATAELGGLLSRLFGQLDALTNFHFTARLKPPEVEVRPNLPALRMEEAMPMATALSHGLAPAEVKAPQHARNLAVSDAASRRRARLPRDAARSPRPGRPRAALRCPPAHPSHAPPLVLSARPACLAHPVGAHRRRPSSSARSARRNATRSRSGTAARSARACARRWESRQTRPRSSRRSSTPPRCAPCSRRTPLPARAARHRRARIG
jgi:hypothetical protein